MNRYYSVILYIVSFTLVAVYIFANNYLAGVTIDNEYARYLYYCTGVSWTSIDGLYSLQNSCLSVTWFPAQLKILSGIEPELFYKLYHLAILPFLPVVVYQIFKLFTKPEYAFIASILFMFQTAFIQSPSMARTNIAILFYAIIILSIFKNYKYNKIVIVVASIMMVLSHYTSSIVAIGTLSAGLFGAGIYYLKYRKSWDKTIPLVIGLVVLAAGVYLWHYVINDLPVSAFVSHNVVLDYESFTDITTRDKVVQSAFGMFGNYPLLIISWIVIGLLSLGLLKKRELPFKMMSLAVYGLNVLFVLLPNISIAYGIERLYYQSLIILGVSFVSGSEYISNKLRIKPTYFMVTVVVIFGVLNYIGGQIPSING